MISSEVSFDFSELRERAKTLLRNARSNDPDALKFLGVHAPNLGPPKLAIAQLALARSLGFASWATLKRDVNRRQIADLFAAVREDRVNDAHRILAANPSLATSRDEHGTTLLLAAVDTNSAAMARMLVQAGVPFSGTLETSAHTALSWALTVNSVEFAQQLVDEGCPVDLFCAAGLGDLTRVKSFWKNGSLIANPSKTGSSRFDENGDRLPRPPDSTQDQLSDALAFAARSGKLEVAEWLLDKGADPNFRGYMGATSLHWAEFSGNLELPDLLRRFGASDEIEDYGFKSKPRAFRLICPAAWGWMSKLETHLEQHPEDVNIRGGFGTPLNAAAWNGSLPAAKFLLSKGADVTLTNAAGLTPPDVARFRGFPELASLFESV